MRMDFNVFLLKNRDFCAFLPANVRFKKSVKYISGPELTMNGRVRFASCAGAAWFSSIKSIG